MATEFLANTHKASSALPDIIDLLAKAFRAKFPPFHRLLWIVLALMTAISKPAL